MSANNTVSMTIYGGSSRNPGPGCWACVVRSANHEQKLTGSHHNTTDIAMKLKAAIRGFRTLNEPSIVTVYTSSEYLQRAMTTCVIPEAGRDHRLWTKLVSLTQSHQVTWLSIRTTSSHPELQPCDEFAVAQGQLSRAPEQLNPQQQLTHTCYLRPASIADAMYEQLAFLLNHKHADAFPTSCCDCDRLRAAQAVLLAPFFTTNQTQQSRKVHPSICDSTVRNRRVSQQETGASDIWPPAPL